MNHPAIFIKQKVFFALTSIRFLDRLYWRKIHGFKSLSICAPSMMEKVFQRAKELGTLDKGDYYEFGIFNGHSLFRAQHIAKKHRAAGMKFYGFDSFQGLPVIKEKDTNGYFYQGQYAYPKADVIHNILSHGGDMDRITLVEGFFDRSLKKSLLTTYHMKKIAIAYIDCDLYSSTKDVLIFMKHLLMKDSLIIFDDWNAYLEKSKDKGEQLAFREFQTANPHIICIPEFLYCWHGHVFRVAKIAATEERALTHHD